MIYFLKKLRHDNITKRNFKKYLLYAIGEIFLVVIGILIALHINNKNENSKKQENLKAVYNRIIIDIDNNIKTAEEIISEYEDIEFVYKRVMNDSSSVELFSYGFDQYTTFLNIYKPDITGLNLLKNLNINNKKAIDIIRIYNANLKEIDAAEKIILENISDNLKDWQKRMPWFAGFVNQKLNKEAQTYFLNSEDYRNKIAYSYLLNYGGYLYNLKNLISELKEWKKKHQTN